MTKPANTIKIDKGNWKQPMIIFLSQPKSWYRKPIVKIPSAKNGGVIPPEEVSSSLFAAKTEFGRPRLRNQK